MFFSLGLGKKYGDPSKTPRNNTTLNPLVKQVHLYDYGSRICHINGKVSTQSSPSPVTTSPSLKLFLGTRTFLSKRLNSPKPLKNRGLMSSLLSLILFIVSGLTVGEGKANASKPGKKLKMLSATFWPS